MLAYFNCFANKRLPNRIAWWMLYFDIINQQTFNYEHLPYSASTIVQCSISYLWGITQPRNTKSTYKGCEKHC